MRMRGLTGLKLARSARDETGASGEKPPGQALAVVDVDDPLHERGLAGKEHEEQARSARNAALKQASAVNQV